MSTVVTASAQAGGVSPAPSRRFSAREICLMALRKIREVSPRDAEADDDVMSIALFAFESILAEQAGTDFNWCLVPETYRFFWPIDTRTDTVANAMGSAYPSLGIVLPLSANLLNEDGQVLGDLPLVRRDEYELVNDKDDTGQPQFLYFGNDAVSPMVSIYRVPDVATWQIELVAQTFARSVRGVQHGANQSGNVDHGFAVHWQRYFYTRVAIEIGSGPVRQVAIQYLNDWRTEAGLSLAALQAYANRQKRSEPARTARWG